MTEFPYQVEVELYIYIKITTKFN